MLPEQLKTLSEGELVPGLLTNKHREFSSAIIDRSLHVHATQIRHVVFGILNNNGNILTTIIGISLKAHIYCTVWTTAHGDNYILIYRPALLYHVIVRGDQLMCT